MPSLQKQVDAVRGSFKALREHYAECRNLANRTVTLQHDWRDLDDALRVPGLKPQERKVLLEKLRKISSDLHRNRPSAVKGPTQKQTSDWALESGQRQGRLALAAVGESWFDDPAVKPALSYHVAQERLRLLAGFPQWWPPLIDIGDQIGQAWRGLPAKINEKLEQSSATGPVEGTADHLGMADHLRLAERLARQVDGTAAPALTLAANPAEEHRKVRLHNLLLWMAERTRHDHWFAEDPNQREPYYVFVGERYTQDALLLVKGKPEKLNRQQRDERVERVQHMEKCLNLAGELGWAPPSGLGDLTSEPTQIEISYKVRPPAAGWVPRGHPVFWLERGKFLEQTQEERKVLEIEEKPADKDISFKDLRVKAEGEPVRVPKVDKTAVTLRGFYRGQRINGETALRLHRMPDAIVSHYPPQENPGIVVQASPQVLKQFAGTNGALAIVLDCSGSMADQNFIDKNGYNRRTPCKYHEATDALGKVLTNLPPGTYVSVFVFSAAARERDEKGRADDNKEARVSLNDTIKRLRAPKRWDPAELPALMDEIENMLPYHHTPLVRSMWEANAEDGDKDRNGGFPNAKDFKGFKTMLVLTDGVDDRFETDRQLHKKHSTQDLSKFLYEEFKDSGVLINVVNFRFVSDAKDDEGKKKEAETKEQFKEAIEKKLHGKIYETKDVDELTDALNMALERKVTFRVKRSSTGTAPDEMPPDGWPITDYATHPNFLKHPGRYRVEVGVEKGAQSPLQQDIELENGQHLKLRLTDDGLGLRLELIRSDDALLPHYEFSQEKEKWRLTAHQENPYREKSGQLELLLTLEAIRERLRREDTVKYPDLQTWLEITPQGQAKANPLALHWGARSGSRYPAPAWGVEVAGWPLDGDGKPDLPTVSAWWLWEQRQPVLQKLLRHGNPDFQTAFLHDNGRIQLGGADSAQIDSVTWEANYPVQVEPGKPLKNMPCLIVRASFPKRLKADDPPNAIWVQLEGLENSDQGQEHRFYYAAGKYVGVFWGLKKTEVEKDLQALKVISLQEFKNKCQREGKHVELQVTQRPK
jgi:hypothetical protein